MLRLKGSVSRAGLLLAAALGVCPAQVFQVDSTNAAATVVSMTGAVSVLRDSQPWALSVGGEVRPQQIIITGADGYALFRISDGSTFEVFPNSRVTFRNTPGDWKDLLEMWLGKIKVHIQKLGGQPNYNRVRTPTAIISVRGTVFDVEVQEEDATLVMVEEGQVDVQHALKGGEPRRLNPGEWIRVDKNQPLAQKMIDRGSVIQSALRAAADAIYSTIYRGSTGGGVPAGGGTGGGGVPGGGGTPGGGGLPGDHDSGGPTPPTPPKSGGGNTTPAPNPGPPPPPPPPSSK